MSWSGQHTTKRGQEEDEVDEIIAAKEPLYFKKPKRKQKRPKGSSLLASYDKESSDGNDDEFQPVAFKSLKDNKFDFVSFKKDHVLKNLGLGNSKGRRHDEESGNGKRKARSQPAENGKGQATTGYGKGSAATLSQEEARTALLSARLPFEDDPVRQSRYKQFLENVISDNPSETLLPHCFNPKDFKEILEFVATAKLYRSLNDMVKNKFTRQRNTDASKASSEKLPTTGEARFVRTVREINVDSLVLKRLGLDKS